MNSTPNWNEVSNRETMNTRGQILATDDNEDSSSSEAASQASVNSEQNASELRRTSSSGEPDVNVGWEVDGDDYYVATNDGVFPLPMSVTAGHHPHRRSAPAQWTATSTDRHQYLLADETRTRTTTRTTRKRRLRSARALKDENEQISDNFQRRSAATGVTRRREETATRRRRQGSCKGSASRDIDNEGGGERFDDGSDLTDRPDSEDCLPSFPVGTEYGNDAFGRKNETVESAHHLHPLHSQDSGHRRGPFSLSRLSESVPCGFKDSGKVQSAKAKIAAVYYSECYEKGIPINYADEAVGQSHSAYVKWWKQNFSGHHQTQKVDPPQRPAAASSRASSWMPPSSQVAAAGNVSEAKTNLLRVLAVSGGDVQSLECQRALEALFQLRKSTGQKSDATTDELNSDWNKPTNALEGIWILLSKPVFPQNLGMSSSSPGAVAYTLGRMSFDMFQPSDLVCPIHGVYNSIQVVDPTDNLEMDKVPQQVRDEMDKRSGKIVLRTYNIISAFSIEPHSTASLDQSLPNHGAIHPIQGIMTTFGYALPDPEVHSRLSVWFTGGMIEVNDEFEDGSEWERIFGCQQDSSGDEEDVSNSTASARNSKHPSKIRKKNSKESLRAQANAVAAKLLLGASPPEGLQKGDTSMSYKLSNPIGGHSKAFVDVMYVDDNFRVMKGHHGTIFVFARQPDSQSTYATDSCDSSDDGVGELDASHAE